MLRLLSHTSADVRIAAAMALPDLDRRSGRCLLSLLEDVDCRVRVACCTGLGRLRYRPSAGRVRALLASDDASLREAAAWTLGRLRDRASESALLAAANDTDVAVRFEAALALAVIDHQLGPQVLEAILADGKSPDYICPAPFLRTVARALRRHRGRARQGRRRRLPMARLGGGEAP